MGIIQSLIGTPRQRLLSSLRGQSATIPDLNAYFEQWPQQVNPELDRLEKHIDEKLDELLPQGKLLRKLKEADSAFFGAAWWPYASFETLCTATYLSIWFSSLVYDYGRASAFREETIRWIRKCVSHEGTDSDLTAVERPSNPFIASFEPVGKAIRESCTPSQIDRFLKELEFYIHMTQVEHEFQQKNQLPTIEEYSERRMGSSAVGVCLAITEYCWGMEIPPSLMCEDDMKMIWDETNMIISATNDILSIKKEIAQGQVDTLIPLLYKRHGSLQTAIDKAANMVQSSTKGFEAASQQLLARHSDNVDITKKLQKFIDGCRYACTANLVWSLRSKRYQLGSASLRDGLKLTL